MLKKLIISSGLLAFAMIAKGQYENNSYAFLKLPFSARVAALGGENISATADELAMTTQNPALLSYVTDRTLYLHYMKYMDGINVSAAGFSRLSGERSSWAVMAQYVDYGKLSETTEEGTLTGTFTAKDIALSGIYTYNLSDYWSGGVRGNFIYGRYDTYSSFAIGVDLGVNYHHPETGFSFSLAARHLGGQIKSFDNRKEELPSEVLLGISKEMKYAPFRFSITLHDLTDWKKKTYRSNGLGRKLLDHLVGSIEFIPTNNFYLATSYNFLRGNEMKINGSGHWAGFSLGTGFNIKRLKVGLAYAKYHVSTSSFTFDLSYSL